MRLKPFSITRGILLAVLVVMALVLTAPQAQAHKVYVFAWVEGDTVYVDAYFSKSRKAQDSLVEVLDDAGQKLLEGRTDDQGSFSFKVPQKTNLHIVVSAGMGHKNEFVLSADEFPDVAGGTSTPAASATLPVAAAPASAATSTSEAAPAAVAGGVDEEQLRRIMDEVLTKHMAPLARAVAALNEEDEGPGAVQIIGGLGWIFGIMGLVMYFRSRKG